MIRILLSLIRLFYFVCIVHELTFIIIEYDAVYTCDKGLIWSCVITMCFVHITEIITLNINKATQNKDYLLSYMVIWSSMHVIVGIWPLYCFTITDDDCKNIFIAQFAYLWYAIIIESCIAVMSLFMILSIMSYYTFKVCCSQDRDEVYVLV